MASRLEIGGISLGVEHLGSGHPTILFLHGITANRRVWDPVIEKLAHRFSCVSVDQRGHGISDKPESGYSHLEYSDDIRGLAQYLSPAAGVYLVGHSLGARNSVVAASRFPELIRGVVAIDFVPFIEAEVFDSLEARVIGGGREFESISDVEDYLRKRYVHLPEDAVSRRALYGYQQSASGGLLPLASPQAMAETVRGLRADLEPYWTSVKVPSIAVRGRQSLLVSEAAFDKACEANSSFARVVVSGADHYVPEEAPDEVAGIVETLIDQHLMTTVTR
jgi:2-(acetamidomethylene)succinate hydrolase